MAKSKRARALFEVMHRQKLAAANGQSGNGHGITASSASAAASVVAGITSPRWWFKSKPASDARVIPPGETAVAPFAPTATAVADEPDPTENDPTARYAADPSTALAPSSIEAPDLTPGVAAPRVQPVSVSVDPERQLINLRLSYTSALIGGFSLFIAIGIAVLIGKTLSRGPAAAIAGTSTQQLRSRPPTPGVLQVPRRGDVKGANDIVEGAAPRTVSATTPPSTGTRNPQQLSYNEPKPPATFFTDDPRRQNGLNYAIIQSYPNKETADKAADFLTKNGVACTVEKDLPGWRLPWKDGVVVVGIRGFAKVSNNPALEGYKKTIVDLGAKFSGRSRFDAFQPSMYMWKKTN